jgi:AhpD family alkylhydroperoxidase
MQPFNLPQYEAMDEQGQSIYNNIKTGLGYVPNLYLTLAHSSNAWAAYMALQQSHGKGSFNQKERDAIQLVVSEANDSMHCVAAHTQLAIGEGFTEEETIQLRRATIEDKKLKAITQLAKEIVERKGRPSEKTISYFFEQGFNSKAVIDLLMVIADKTIMNYAENIMQPEWQFEPAKKL